MTIIQPTSLFERLGGTEALERVIGTFYDYVSEHPDLSPLFPEELTETKRKQVQFMTQFTGGQPLYTAEHGHPRLRARHLPFEITPRRAEAWLVCMKLAIEDHDLPQEATEEWFHRLSLTASHMVNQH
ncbi:globin [Geomicrobium sp. JCM 19038]|uniref:globin domain-containing protein n=1 Tax=Geomicrobium sp. JCM 19038 TaxID=1460635 RepID=UPI00045F3B64|nr:globin [Geomicrobium sp. JCM 19038]GAK10141.1 hemoglobin-like protein HbO [Geomicrobium sp. JCM 19038]